MKRILSLTFASLMALALSACEDKSPQPVIKKAKSNEGKDEGPEYFDHSRQGMGEPRQSASKYPQANGNVPLTKNPGQSGGAAPSTKNSPPAPAPNAPQNISRFWDGSDFYSNTNVEVKPLVTE